MERTAKQAERAQQVAPLVYSVPEAAVALRISETGLWTLLKRRAIPSFHIGGRRVIRVAALGKWCEQMERAEMEA